MTRSIIVTWDKMGSEFTYSLLYAKNIKGPWIRHHDFRITDSVIDILRRSYPAPYNLDYDGDAVSGYEAYLYNLYMITGLDDDTIYYVKVECHDKYHQWWYSYDSQTSIGGGESTPYETPVPDGGNSLGFQFNITL
jgi:hypothetical protein